MTAKAEFSSVIERFTALDIALDEHRQMRRPEYARRLAALALLNDDRAPDLLAARANATAETLAGAPGVSKTARSLFAAALTVANRNADDYLRARETLLPVMRNMRKGLPAAALLYAAAGKTEIDGADRARIASIAPLVRAPWWTSAAARNGDYAAAFALEDDRLDVIEARIEAARRALASAGAGEGLARDGGRQLALTGAEPVAAARAWAALRDARRGTSWRALKPPALIDPAAAAGARLDDAVAMLDLAGDAVSEMRPRVDPHARSYLIAGLVTQALAPSPKTAHSSVAALRAVQVAIEAEWAAVIAATTAVAASSG